MKNKSSVRQNKASQLFTESNNKKLASIAGKQEKEPFKLTKFKNVDPRTNTHIKTNKDSSIANQSQVPSQA